MKKQITIAIADDHTLLRKGLIQILEREGFRVLAEADNGKELIERLALLHPDVVIMDYSMPVMDGVEATTWLRNNRPDVHVLALSMFDDDTKVIQMIRAGAKGYVLKDSEPREVRAAIEDIVEHGFHYSPLVNGSLVHSVNGGEKKETGPSFTEREREYLRHASTDMTHREIAGIMSVSPRTVDGYRDELFAKLNIKSRVGLAAWAIRNGYA